MYPHSANHITRREYKGENAEVSDFKEVTSADNPTPSLSLFLPFFPVYADVLLPV